MFLEISTFLRIQFFLNHTCGSALVTTSSFRSSSCFFEGHVTLCSVCVCVWDCPDFHSVLCDGTDSCWKDRKISCFMTHVQSCFYWQKKMFFIFNLVLPHVTMTIQSILFNLQPDLCQLPYLQSLKRCLMIMKYRETQRTHVSESAVPWLWCQLQTQPSCVCERSL